jgi:hypothetical protein
MGAVELGLPEEREYLIAGTTERGLGAIEVDKCGGVCDGGQSSYIRSKAEGLALALRYVCDIVRLLSRAL